MLRWAMWLFISLRDDSVIGATLRNGSQNYRRDVFLVGSSHNVCLHTLSPRLTSTVSWLYVTVLAACSNSLNAGL